MNQRTLEPLSEAPTSGRAAYLGSCLDCGRPVGKRSQISREPGLRRWLAPGTESHPTVPGGVICQSCSLKRSRRSRPKSEPSNTGVPPRKTERLSDRTVRQLRLMIGACVECGWADDGPGNPHDCLDTQRAI